MREREQEKVKVKGRNKEIYDSSPIKTISYNHYRTALLTFSSKTGLRLSLLILVCLFDVGICPQ